jgi:hypothetical protein
MARIRSIKPEFWTSAQILDCSPNARLMFIGIWNFADDAGRHPWSPRQIKAEIFPADEIELKYILEWLKDLETNGLIARYVADDKDYFYVTGWKHQRIDKPQTPKYPDPFHADSKSIPRTIPPDTIRYDTIREDKRVEVAPKKVLPKTRGTRLPSGWAPSPEGHLLAAERLGESGVAAELDKFRDYWVAAPGQKGTKLDWDATWRNWVRNAKGLSNGKSSTLKERYSNALQQLGSNQLFTDAPVLLPKRGSG